MRRISKNSTSDSIWHKDGQDRLLSHQVSCRVVTKNNPKKHSQTDKKKFINQSYTQTHHASRYYTLNGLFNTEVLPGLNVYIPVLSCN